MLPKFDSGRDKLKEYDKPTHAKAVLFYVKKKKYSTEKRK